MVEYWIERFGQLPLHFLNYFGSTDIEDLFSTLDYAVYEHDIAHIILDNLQFMLSNQKYGFDRFEQQDRTISALRRFATERNVHISLVIHPKKVEEDELLSISSVFGGGKATQEADNVFILQKFDKYRRIDVKKNRFDGGTGHHCIGFDNQTKRYFQLENQEVQALENSENENLRTVIKRREAVNHGVIDPHVERLGNKLGPPPSENPLPNTEAKIQSAKKKSKAWPTVKSKQMIDEIESNTQEEIEKFVEEIQEELDTNELLEQAARDQEQLERRRAQAERMNESKTFSLNDSFGARSDPPPVGADDFADEAKTAEEAMKRPEVQRIAAQISQEEKLEQYKASGLELEEGDIFADDNPVESFLSQEDIDNQLQQERMRNAYKQPQTTNYQQGRSSFTKARLKKAKMARMKKTVHNSSSGESDEE